MKTVKRRTTRKQHTKVDMKDDVWGKIWLPSHLPEPASQLQVSLLAHEAEMLQPRKAQYWCYSTLRSDATVAMLWKTEHLHRGRRYYRHGSGIQKIHLFVKGDVKASLLLSPRTVVVSLVRRFKGEELHARWDGLRLSPSLQWLVCFTNIIIHWT